MHAKEKSFEEIMTNEIKIVIPFFQRAYVWEKEHWQKLFDDLVENFDKKTEHFLGAILLKRSQGGDNFSSVIDGQQRLTTFSILLKVLYDNIDIKNRQFFNACLFEKDSIQQEPKIKHSKFDRKEYIELFKEFQARSFILEKDKKEKSILGCYNFFVQQIYDKLKTKEQFLKFMKFIRDTKFWVSVNLDSNEDEQKIFDSINTAGVKLTATDIIKNALFDKAIKLQIDYETLYKNYWESIFEAKDNVKFWNSESATGRLRRTQSEIFLHAFAIIKGFFDTETSLEHLSTKYKEQIVILNKNTIENFLIEINKYAERYLEFPKIQNNMPLSFENTEFKLFHILKIADINTIIPLLLKLKFLKYEKRIDEKSFEKCFELLEIFIITNYICKRTTKDYNTIFYKLTQKIDEQNPTQYIKDFLNREDEKGQKYLSSKNDIKNALLSIKENKKGKLILFWIELFRRYKNKGQDIIELSYSPYTLEHLMPQAWQSHWSEVGKNKENAEKLTYQIGNMTLLKGSLNSTIKNETWNIKLNGYKNNKKYSCIKNCADLKITKDDLLNKDEWGKNEILTRTENLTKEFFKIWNIKKFE